MTRNPQGFFSRDLNASLGNCRIMEPRWAFVVQSLNNVQLFVTPWTADQTSLSFIISQSFLKFMSVESVMPSNRLILCHCLLLLPSIFPSIRVFPNESALCIKWPKYWNFSFSISPSSEYLGLISFRIDWRRAWTLRFLGLYLPREPMDLSGRKRVQGGPQICTPLWHNLLIQSRSLNKESL